MKFIDILLEQPSNDRERLIKKAEVLYRKAFKRKRYTDKDGYDFLWELSDDAIMSIHPNNKRWVYIEPVYIKVIMNNSKSDKLSKREIMDYIGLSFSQYNITLRDPESLIRKQSWYKPEEQLRNITEDNDAIVRKKLNVLYKAFRKGKMTVNYHIFGRPIPWDERSVEVVVEYELPNLYKIVINDIEKIKRYSWSYNSRNAKNTIYINDIKINSDKPIHPNDLREVKNIVKDKLERKFFQMGNADLVFSPITNDMEFASDYTQGDKLNLKVGQPVEHEKLGKGIVTDLNDIGGNKVATIKFIGVGYKKIILHLAKMRTWD